MIMSSFPAQGAFDITPSDATPITFGGRTRPCRGLWIGFAGDVGVRTLEGNDVIIKNVPVGTLHVACTWVFSTGTTASSIVGLV
jgi:hypothetical protein